MPLVHPVQTNGRNATGDFESRRDGAARILVCEPHPEARAFLERALRHLGYEPVPYEPALAGEQPACDAVLLTPSFADGLTLARSLRRERPDIPIVCLSGTGVGPDALALEPVACLVKPVPLDELARVLEQAVAAGAARGVVRRALC